MFRTLRSIFSCAAILLSIVTPLVAQVPEEKNPYELSIDDLYYLKIDSVFAASKHEQNPLEAPASVTIITGEEIQRYGYRDLADVIRHVRGFYATYDRNYSYLGTRGFNRPGDYSSRFLVLIDGHRTNDNVFDLVLSGTEFPLDLQLIDRIEIVRGPSSALYGTSAVFAVINVITRNGKNLEGPLFSQLVGSLGTAMTRASWGTRFGKTSDLIISSSAYRSEGYKELHYAEFDGPDGPGLAKNLDRDKRGSIFVKASSENFTLEGVYGSRTKFIPTGSYGTVLNDPRNRTRDDRGFIDAAYERQLGRGWKFNSRLYYDLYNYDNYSAYAGDDTDGNAIVTLNKDSSRGQWLGEETRISKKLGAKHLFTAGSEYRYNIKQDLHNMDLQPQSTVYEDVRNRSRVWAIFGEEEFQPTRKLRVNIGVRHDHYPNFGGPTNPRAALIFNPDSTSAIKLLYGRAFRAPNVYELSWSQIGIGQGNPNLHPETLRSTEVVVEKNLPRHWTASTQAYYFGIRDMVTQWVNDDGIITWRNFGRVRASGWEAELERKTGRGFETRVSYALQFSKDQDTGQSLTNSPRRIVQLKIGNTWLGGRLWTGSDFYAMSSRLTLAGNQAKGHLVPNITIGTGRPIHHLDLTASLYNTTNSRYSDVGSDEHRQDVIQQDGRTFRVSLTYRPGDRQ